MAAPTDVRVESVTMNSTVLNWTYGGANPISVYRALHGGVFSEVTDVGTRVPPGTTTYQDSTVDSGVFYDYKLSDDAGSTFSSIVSVVVQTCESSSGSTQSTNAPGLPQFTTDEDVSPENLQQLSQQVEASLSTQLMQPQDCIVCPVNQAVVLECTDSCFNFTIVIPSSDPTINSITIHGCNTGVINLVCPPNTTCEVCGWPVELGFTGDECFHAPIIGGATGRTASIPYGNGKSKDTNSKKGYSGDPRGGGGAGTLGCACPPSQFNSLRIACCTVGSSTNCTMNCGGGAQGKRAQLKICGGRGPYTMSHSGGAGGVKFTGNPNDSNAVKKDTTILANEGSTIYVVPPTNTGPLVAGLAYTKAVCGVGACGPVVGGVTWALFNCDDTFTVCNTTQGGTVDAVAFLSSTVTCSTCSNKVVSNCASTLISCDCNGAPGGECTQAQSCGAVEDRRTGPMIASGCKPCALSDGAVITVTDSTGASASVIMKA